MKKLGLGPKMILSFLVAIAGSVVICGVITYSRTKNVLNSNMQLTSEQTLESALNSLQTYEKTISLPVDLLTRKTSIKQLEYEDQFDDYIANVQDELVAACKVTQGAVRSYYATSSGKLITGWVKYEDNGDKTAMNTIEENVDLSGEDWYVNCQGRKAKVNSIFSYITQPYEDPQTGGQIFTVAQEVKYKDVLMGVVAMDIDAAQLENYIRNIRILNTGFAMLIDADGNIVIDSDKNTFADGNVTGLEFWTPISGELKSLRFRHHTGVCIHDACRWHGLCGDRDDRPGDRLDSSGLHQRCREHRQSCEDQRCAGICGCVRSDLRYCDRAYYRVQPCA